MVTGQSPAQASVAPSPLRQEPQVPQPSMGAPYAPHNLPQNTTQDKQEQPKNTNMMNNRYPVVKLGRLPVIYMFYNYFNRINNLLIFILLISFPLQEGLLKRHEVSGDERARKNSTMESDSDDNVPLKAKTSVNIPPPVDKDREAIDIAREKNWEAVKRKHEEASKKEEAEASIGIFRIV